VPGLRGQAQNRIQYLELAQSDFHGAGRGAATTGTLDMAEAAGAFGAGITYVLALVLAIALGI
jgi:hypothetical protein